MRRNFNQLGKKIKNEKKRKIRERGTGKTGFFEPDKVPSPID
jgi:hypothetical protein